MFESRGLFTHISVTFLGGVLDPCVVDYTLGFPGGGGILRANAGAQCPSGLFLTQDLHVPNEDRIKQLLGQDAWTSQKSELAGFYPRLMAKSDTGKIGLINLGNTCYVNSILQALFMASE